MRALKGEPHADIAKAWALAAWTAKACTAEACTMEACDCQSQVMLSMSADSVSWDHFLWPLAPAFIAHICVTSCCNFKVRRTRDLRSGCLRGSHSQADSCCQRPCPCSPSFPCMPVVITANFECSQDSPDRVTPTGELSQPTTTSLQPSLSMRAFASAALRPAAAMRPPVMLLSGAMRPRW